MAVALESVVKQLTDSGIIAQGELENFIPPKANPQSVEELVSELVKNNRLTRFQAAQVAAGKAKALILGEYTILDKIGAGGMGQVFKALHRRMERTVAIKVLPPTMTKDAAALARFQREVVAAAKLHHTNIVTAYDAGQANGVHFLVMEYVDGQDLSALVKKNGPIPVAKAVNYILQAARGLEFAHSEGVVHRDIKPANLLLDKKGGVKILDMGLARIESPGAAQAELTGTGAVMGTVDYMSPEQAFNTKDADARADIYSLGCSLYYLIAGKATYDGQTVVERILAHREKEIPSLRSVSAEASDQLDAIFKKLVAKKIEDRYQTMTEVIADLERLGGNSGTVSDPYAATAALNSGALAALKNIEVSRTTAKTTATKQVAAAKASGSKQPPWKNVKVLIGAGAAGLALLLGVILIVRNKDDKEVAHIDAADGTKVTLPAGGSVQVLGNSGANPIGPTPPLAIAPYDAAQAKAHQAAWAKHLGTEVETTNSVGMKMVLIPPGEFMMGSTDEQVEAALKGVEVDNADKSIKDRIQKIERPQHRVVITKPFLMGATEVTVGQFKKFSEATGYQTEAEQATKSNYTFLKPGFPVTDDNPAGVITWNDAVAYCQWLSGQERTSYRLPTEAEWEYACRAGTTTQYSFGDDYNELSNYGWYNKNSGGKSHPVGTLLPNAFGLLDMHGNLQEWCHDHFVQEWYTKSPAVNPVASVSTYRVLRSGNWSHIVSACRSATRLSNTPSSHNYPHSGFRIVCEIPTPTTTALATTSTPSEVTPPASTPVPPLAVAPFDAAQAKAHQQAWAKHLGIEVETPNSVGMTMVLIPPGEFMMGSTDEQVEAALKVAEAEKADSGTKDRIQNAERPQHKVVITKPFLMSATEVTVGQFKKFIEATKYVTEADNAAKTDAQVPTYLNPGQAVTDDSPAALITWNDAVAYCKWLSDQENRTYRLPTEAEWEYACRAGTTTQYSFGDDYNELPKFGWLSKNAGGKTHPVGTLPPNSFGLFDMHGNVFEWCGDFYDEMWYEKSHLSGASPNGNTGPDTGSSRVVRGGHWTHNASSCRSASRHYFNTPSARYNSTGFRIVREVTAPAAERAIPVSASHKLFIHDPAFPAWMAQVQAMPAEQQIEAVRKKLMELNPGFDGVVTGLKSMGVPTIANDTVVEIGLVTEAIVDVSPIRALTGLTGLQCDGMHRKQSAFADLSPLQGMQLTRFTCIDTSVSDLTPLQVMPLSVLNVARSGVVDLSPLAEMNLTTLVFSETPVADLAPLSGMPLSRLEAQSTNVVSLMPLVECKTLELVNVMKTKVSPATVAALQKALPNCKIEWDDPAKATTPQPAASSNLFMHDPAFPQWMKEVAAMPAEEQVKAVSKKLVELNSGFDGTMTNWDGKGAPTIENGVVTQIECLTDDVTDISPVRALVGLQTLVCRGSGQGKGRLTDLTPIKDMPLKHLYVDLDVALDTELFRSIKTLETINYKPIAEFWKEVEGK